MSEITDPSLLDFVEKYVAGKNPLVTVLVSPSVYEKTKSDFAQAGFEEIKK